MRRHTRLMLTGVNPEIYIFNGLNGVAGGNIILMKESIGYIASRPDTFTAICLDGALISRIDNHAVVVVEFDDIFCKVSIWDRTDLDENARDRKFDVFAGLHVSVDE